MKTKIVLHRLIACVALGFACLTALAAEKPAQPAGPNGGRILKTEPRAEFFITKERKVQITFLDAANKPVAPAEQVVTVTAGERASPVTMKFAKAGAGPALVSDVALPAGNDVPAVIQIKASAAAKTTTDRFNVDLSICGECKKAEYACVCH